MTPAVELVKKAKIDFNILEYHHDTNNSAYGQEAATSLGLDPAQVFKTLLVSDNTNGIPTACAMVPVSHQLDLKAVAKHLGLKKILMANPTCAQKSTGYLVGGISPLAQKKSLPTLIDVSAQHFHTVYVSAGRRGLELALSPKDLASLCRGCFVDIKQIADAHS